VFKDATGNVVATWQVVDNVAPMLLKGTYSFGGAQDTLKAKFSEPLKALDKNGTWIEWGKIEVGGAPELLQQLAQIYVGPGTKFPPMPDPPPGFVIRVTADKVRGMGPWGTQFD
jgi:hypothetical protein